jgi:hypothetical protein
MKPERDGLRRSASDACFAMKDQNVRCSTAEGENARRMAWTGQTYVDEFRLQKCRDESDSTKNGGQLFCP